MSERAAQILLVDDDRHVLHTGSRILKQAGHEVVVAATGSEGLRLASEQKPDLILLDVVLPDISGVELCRRIKGDSELARCYVVLASNVKTLSEDQAGGLEAGADGYLARPISNRELLARVEAMLRIKRTEEALAAEKERMAVTLRSIGDGVITTDLQGRVVMLNRIAERLCGWSNEEAARQPLLRVLHLVNEQTNEPCNNPVDQVLQSGQIVGLSNHTILIAKDGARRHIADSAAPIRDQEGNPIGVVMVFRGRHSAASARGGAAESAETGISRHTRRRNCPRLQQPAHRHPGQHHVGENALSADR